MQSEKTLIVPREDITYLPHQEEGIRWMIERESDGAADICRGGVLGDDMGLGKTFQTIGLLKNGSPRRTLILCPPALIAGWATELDACGYRVGQMKAGSCVWSVSADTPPTEAVWLTTYARAVLYFKQMAREEPAFTRLVLDEGHVIRNGPQTARWRACMLIGARAEARWILSATPIQNGPEDWRNLCRWLRARVPDAMMERLASVIMLRRTMADLRKVIRALPPPPRFINHNLELPTLVPDSMQDDEAKIFRVLCNRLEDALDQEGVKQFIVLELYLRIQQFLVHPQIYIEGMRSKFRGAYPRADWAGTATKWSTAMSVVESAIVEKVPTIVFCQFRREIEMAATAIEAMGGRVWTIGGGGTTAVGAVVSEARAAAAAGESVVIIVQIVAGGAGLNLQFCRRIVFLSQHWNPAVVHQAVGRAVRIGQSAVVDVHMFRIVDAVMDNLDRRMLQVHNVKIDAARSLCGSLYDGYAPITQVRNAFAADDPHDGASQERANYRCRLIKEELMAVTWHPQRFLLWCVDTEESAEWYTLD